jgi:hypothetical protein
VTKSDKHDVPHDQEDNQKNKIVTVLVVIVPSLIFLYVLFKADWGNAWELIWNINGGHLVIAFLIYFLMLVIRSLRYGYILSITKFLPLLLTTLVSNLLLQILPFRSGELTFPLLLRRQMKHPLHKGFGAVIAVRLTDLACVIIGGSVAFVFSRDLNDNFGLLAIVTGICGVASVCLIYYSGAFGHIVLDVIRFILKQTPVRNLAVLRDFHGNLRLASSNLETLRNFRRLVALLCFSSAIYVVSITFNIYVFRIMLIDTDTLSLVLACTIVFFTVALPISIGSFGLFEGGLMMGLMMFANYSASLAATLGIVVHLVQLLMVGATGALGYGLMFYIGRNKKTFETEK